MTDYSILLPFTAPWGGRKWMHGLFRRDGLICASNGGVIVCLPDDGTAGDMPKAPIDVRNTLTKYPPIEGSRPLPAMHAPDKKCDCVPREVRHDPCQDCDGDGGFWRGDHRYDCKECDGYGITNHDLTERWLCNRCFGIGKRYADYERQPEWRIQISGRDFQQQLVWLISRLPDVEVSAALAPIGHALRIRFAGGGDGALLGVTL